MDAVHFVRGTPTPEKLVCEAARNDYRTEGVAEHDFEDVMADVSPDRDLLVENVERLRTDSWDADTVHAVLVGDEYVHLEAKKQTLLRQLMRRGHWGVFEHPQATLELHGVTRVAMAQITRHRHFTFDIMSLRYCDVSDVSDVEGRFEVPPEVTGGEAVDRDGVHDVDGDAADVMLEAYEVAIDYYRMLLDRGVPQEEARKVLPMGTKVNMVMSGNARAWFHLLNIRGKANVQGEARRLADGIYDELSDWLPFALPYFDEHELPMELTP